MVVSVFVCVEDSLLRQDDIWMLDGDEPQEHLSHVPRPDHLDFLRITPPEDDIIGDTPYYCPKLECTVRALKQHQHLQIKIMHIFTLRAVNHSTPFFFSPRGTHQDFSPLGHLTT